MTYVRINSIQVAQPLKDFVEHELLQGLNVSAAQVWALLETLVNDLGVENQALLDERAHLQSQIDAWHKQNRSHDFDRDAYKAFLQQIGYLLPEPAPFEISTQNVDPEISSIAGPQLVVPIMNARYALNAANARWGSLYDALYGTDAIDEEQGKHRDKAYNPVRGAAVIAWTKAFLDQAVPLADGQWAQVTWLRVQDGALNTNKGGLKHPKQFAGYKGQADAPAAVLLKNNGLGIGLRFDATHFIGKDDPMQLADVALESALSSIMDCEDSVAAVDADDKVVTYRNWLGLMRGDLSTSVDKGSKSIERNLRSDQFYTQGDGSQGRMLMRALMFVRNVGHLMRNPAVLDKNGQQAFEGLLDGLFTTLGAMHDLKKSADDTLRNSRSGSVYIVKPKMHGPKEVAFAVKLFDTIEQGLGLARNTLKIGIMDEEKRTSVNLRACIYEARERVVFINTGFLDRTGDEIHTAMEAGAVVRKADMKQEKWIETYENWNVESGLACGFMGRAQIGKGMWAMPDRMSAMLEQKIEHPKAAANCAWVPSPTAATLHATHYHRVSVKLAQLERKEQHKAQRDDLLQIPVHHGHNWSAQEIQDELRNNAQGILGYVVRWIDAGIGCSKVPDINNVALMEDRATCRISSQILANWLHHGIISESQVVQTMTEMAAIVDQQNKNTPDYRPMSSDLDGFAFQAALALVLKGREQPSGYTEPLLHSYRLRVKNHES